MSFLDKAKEKAQQLVETAKERVDDFKDNRKSDELLSELGRLSYRQHTHRQEAGHQAAVDKLITQLKEMEDEGADLLPDASKQDDAASSDSSPAGSGSDSASSDDDAMPGTAASGVGEDSPAPIATRGD